MHDNDKYICIVSLCECFQVVRLDGPNKYHRVLLSHTKNETSVARPVALAVDPLGGCVIYI